MEARAAISPNRYMSLEYQATWKFPARLVNVPEGKYVIQKVRIRGFHDLQRHLCDCGLLAKLREH